MMSLSDKLSAQWGHSQRKAKETSDSIQEQQRQKAWAAVAELPEQVEAAMLETSNHIVGEMECEVQSINHMILQSDSSEHSEDVHPRLRKAVADVRDIPMIMQDKLETRVAQTGNGLRSHIVGLFKDLAEESWDDSGSGELRFKQELQVLPEMVQQLAGEALSTAVSESTVETKERLDSAMKTLPEKTSALQMAKIQMVKRAAHSSDALSRAAQLAAGTPMKQALATMSNQQDLQGAVTNQVVATMLLQAKAMDAQPKHSGSDRSGLENGLDTKLGESIANGLLKGASNLNAAVSNPGSIGHSVGKF
jgi:hypothetical protein